MRHVIRSLVISLGIVGLTTACGVGSTSPGRVAVDPTPRPDSGPTTPDAGPVTPTPTTASLVVDNETPYDIYYLYVSPSWSSDWGPDQLGSSRIIPAYSSFELDGIPCGDTYDLRADDADRYVLAERYGVSFACGGTNVWTLR